jgi:hypothetical protein
MTRHIIIGWASRAFCCANATWSRAWLEIILVSDDPHGFYSRPGLAYYLSGEIPESSCSFLKGNWTDVQLVRAM